MPKSAEPELACRECQLRTSSSQGRRGADAPLKRPRSSGTPRARRLARPGAGARARTAPATAARLAQPARGRHNKGTAAVGRRRRASSRGDAPLSEVSGSRLRAARPCPHAGDGARRWVAPHQGGSRVGDAAGQRPPHGAAAAGPAPPPGTVSPPRPLPPGSLPAPPRRGPPSSIPPADTHLRGPAARSRRHQRGVRGRWRQAPAAGRARARCRGLAPAPRCGCHPPSALTAAGAAPQDPPRAGRAARAAA
ncbi:skin secretory protein xP2-like [Nyctibius grandis]|uniref:skin secretory protein xP2-like n=1 Tax=Nyctibius grandis TaxID=48427 RepID=UPI0035BC2569